NILTKYSSRVCPGCLLAENMLWLESACLLAAFTFSHSKDQNEKIIDICYAATSMAGFCPANFHCSITPRSNNVEWIIQEMELL
ncbi:hypothetical protein M422DRAFT_190774, partial [Sphaerobolus stellatus SS14]